MDEQEKGQTYICPSSPSLANTGMTQNGAPENPVNQATLNASIANNHATSFDNLPLTQSTVRADSICGQHTNDGSPVNVALADSAQPIDDEKYPWPPGFAGKLAKFIYSSSYLPVREVAISATLGLLAGVCGRAFTISDKSTSLYIILVARSGIGKDGMHEAIHKMIKLADVPSAEKFINASNFASGPALHKAILKQPGFLNLQGEWGRTLKRMGNPRDTPMQDLRTVMTDAFGKKYLDGKTYSDGEKSMLGITWPALSFLGETTPSTFYEALNPDMLADGFMSRFLVISHSGERPPPNDYRCSELKTEDLEQLKAILERAIPYQQPMFTPQQIEVEFLDEEVKDKMHRFELSCGNSINEAGEDEAKRQMYNRAHLKALQIAALLAIADNEVMPKIDLGHATWAITIVRNDIEAFSSKLTSGDIGNDDHTRETKLLSIIRKYFKNEPAKSYNINPLMRKDGVITRKYLQVNSSSSPPFNNHKLGASAALDLTINILINNGHLVEIQKHRIPLEWGTFGKVYRIVSLPE